jgi:hypothetical protein
VIKQTTKLFQKISSWAHVFHWVESGLFVFYITGILWIILKQWLCQSQNCDYVNNQIDLGLIVQVGFIISGIINSIRIAIVYVLHDKDPKPERWFFFSLFLNAISFIIIGYYFRNNINSSIEYISNKPLYALLTLSIFSSSAIILADKISWHNNSTFVQIRISVTLFSLMILFFSPGLGFFSSLLIMPFLLFVKDDISTKTIKAAKFK